MTSIRPPHVGTSMVGRSSSTARLIADCGVSAADIRSFFRHPGFLTAEGVTHTLHLWDGRGEARIPLVVRPIPGSDLLDAVSPYGYPGAGVDGAAIDPGLMDLSGLGLVSVFVRDVVPAPALAGGLAQSIVRLHDPAAPRRLGKSFRRAVRRCTDAGYRVEVTPGQDVPDGVLDRFHDVYLRTMDRRDAKSRYRFDRTYLRECLATGLTWLVHAADAHGALAAGDLVVRSDDVLHSLLFGTHDDHLPASPGKLVTVRDLDLADELGTPFNVGGGLAAGDGLDRSKLAYCNASSTYVCHHLVCDPEAYRRLSGDAGESRFFPAYRASRSGSTASRAKIHRNRVS
ncbi:GNAT family N-acetyltransferase [Pseudonocardia sp. McavD-2-B]|uniref:GNAT family N-acetyltransferase n=1 Tax=Pseudonocardia sp. McavD-2-B TaxID=2954499 RepID=UPI0020972995|nr:GNAT family N-acetyltransferase [Pseudonocardia sp. McavD-2-B]MCO7193205.1 GNAT family N-acetyltransferase [Pseudonocardia sp. McavD-2-B]